MMYRLDDTAAAVREIQKYMHTISDGITDSIPRIAIDGIYGSETREAVRAFQEYYGLFESGVVDLITFNLLFSIFDKMRDERRIQDYVITDFGFPIKLGTQNADVAVIHILISELSESFDSIGDVGRGRYFSEKSEEAVQTIQDIFGMPKTGEVDKNLYERMMLELDAIKRLKEIYD